MVILRLLIVVFFVFALITTKFIKLNWSPSFIRIRDCIPKYAIDLNEVESKCLSVSQSSPKLKHQVLESVAINGTRRICLNSAAVLNELFRRAFVVHSNYL